MAASGTIAVSGAFDSGALPGARVVPVTSVPEPSARRRIRARQIPELLFEALKTQVEIQRPAIFGEKPPDFVDFRTRVDVREFHHAYTLLRYSF